ncbi:MAG: response regulator transcription factor [Deferribacteres bacterium]|nr:response regulator transcription factor [Deferribacteres bacterium]
MEKQYLILIIDRDYRVYYRKLSDSLRECCRLVVRSNPANACRFFIKNNVDIVLLGHTRNFPCFDTLTHFKSVKPSVPVFVITDCGSEETAVKAFRCGARDYFRKPIDVAEVIKSLRHVLSFKQGMNIGGKEFGPNNFRAAVQSINGGFNRKIRLPDIARKAGMSISCFERTFKKKMGVTFTAYVNNLRISRSIELMKEEDYSIGEIAYACGFTSQFHFTRMFKKIMNISPGRYKRSLKNQAAVKNRPFTT